MSIRISGRSCSVVFMPVRWSLWKILRIREGAVLFFLLLFTWNNGFAQTRLVLNGGIINLSQGASLVIANPAADAITRTSGYIISEGENNRIQWNIGTTLGTYTIPWGYGTNYIPLTFTKTAGAGTGNFVFSTYHTGWQNSLQLPTGVANINGVSGFDNSAFVSDRFWQVNAQGYTTKPTLSNVVFTYIDAENLDPNNSIVQSALVAKRYNSALTSWTDNIPASTVNTTNNTVTVTSVDAANLQPWWVVGTTGENRYWVAPSNSTSNLSANWSVSPGGAGSAGVPTFVDGVIFDGTMDANCTLNAPLTAASLIVNAGYTGTITQGSQAINISKAATFSGGTFLGGTSVINISGPLTISGTAFTSTSGSLDVKKDFTLVSGSFTHNNGTVRFSGATPALTQNISGSVAATFNDIVVTNNTATPGVSIESNQNLRGVLTLSNNVIFDADGTANSSVFKLLSTADNPTQDAAIAALPPAARVTGNVTVERYMTKEGWNNTRIYRYISSPVQNATVSDIQNEITITGSFAGTSVCSGCGTAQSMFNYSESVITDTNGSGTADFNDGYIDFPSASNTETLAPGRGYAMFVRGNVLPSTSWDVRGPVNTGNVTAVSFPVTFTSSGNIANDGWNLVGNPFPSTIDWNSGIGWTKTNIDASIYITDNGSSSNTQYATWNGVVGTNGGSRYIATGQGFWIKANDSGAPVLAADENIKSPGIQTVFFREESLEDLLRITVTKGVTRDEAVIHFREDASEDFDTHADALKLPNSTFNLSTIQPDGKKYAINSVPVLSCNSTMALNIENIAIGIYQLSFSDYESFPEGTTITLQDNFTATSFDISSGASYNFSVTSNSASYGPARFRLLFTRAELSSDLNVTAADVCEDADALITLSNPQDGVSYSIVSANGLASTPQTGIGNPIFFSISGDSLVKGENALRIRAAWETCSLQVEKNVKITVEEKPVITAVENGTSCREGAVTLNAYGPENTHYNWYETELSESADPAQHASSFVTPLLTKSKTYFVSAVSSSGCESSRKPVIANVIYFDDAQISLNEKGDSLKSNYSAGNQWYLNGEIIPLAISQFIKPDKSGSYSVQVSVGGCSTSAGYDYIITAVEGEESKFISVYPNPTVKEINIEIPSSFKDIEDVKLVNAFGQLIGPIELYETEGTLRGWFDMTKYAAGVYILQIAGKGEVVEIKIIKEK